MTPDWLDPILEWLTLNPDWAGFIIFLVALCESLLIVGVLVPGALLMLGAGTLIALGALDLWITLACAIAGAVAGDSISFWIGYHFKERIHKAWPFRSHPNILLKGERFFLKHGGKSIVLGRFVGPIRAVIPTVAGIMGMSPRHFAWVNVLSAIAWAPAYILPGVAVGASLSLAAQVATRLGILVLLLIIGLWLIFWLIRHSVLWIQPRLSMLIKPGLQWRHHHPVLAYTSKIFLDPQQPETPTLSGFAVILFSTLSVWLFVVALLHGTSSEINYNVDGIFYQLMQIIRTPVGDDFFVSVSLLGSTAFLMACSISVFLFVLFKKNKLAIGCWVAALFFSFAVDLIIKHATIWIYPARFYPHAEFIAVSSQNNFYIVIYGFLAVLLAQELPYHRRWIPYAFVALTITSIALSRLYIGAQWLSDVIAALAISIAGVALLAMVYQQQKRTQSLRYLGCVCLIVLGFMALWEMPRQHSSLLALYTPKPSKITMTENTWRSTGWQSLSAYRIDIQGKNSESMTIQWAGQLTNIGEKLTKLGWSPAAKLSTQTALMWLTPEPDFEVLPVLPMVHNGRHEALIFYKLAENEKYVLRLWSTNRTLQPGGKPLWLGFVQKQIHTQNFIFTHAISQPDSNPALQNFIDMIKPKTILHREQLLPKSSAVLRNGTTILLDS